MLHRLRDIQTVNKSRDVTRKPRDPACLSYIRWLIDCYLFQLPKGQGRYSLVNMKLNIRSVIHCLKAVRRQKPLFPYPVHILAKIQGVPFGIDPWCSGSAREKKAGDNQPWNYSRRFPTYSVCGHDTSTSRTDGETDGRTTCRNNTALWVASRRKYER